MKKRYGVLAFSLLFLFSCGTSLIEKNLAPEEKEFLSSARYIITRQERKVFLSLPAAERKTFIEEFWKKRDPEPDTEKNEFKDQYYKRIQEANHLFSEGGHHGWLQDRGRVYILLGPPEQRETYPRGMNFYDPPSEIWHYGFHRLYFIDYRWNGNFTLIPESARMLAEINAAQVMLRPKGEKETEKVFFDFDLNIEKSGKGVLLRIDIPYKDIWFALKENKFETSLELYLKVTDRAEKEVFWEETKTHAVSLTEDELKELRDKNYLIEIPLRLQPGDYAAIVILKNITDKSQVRKKIKLTIEER